MKTIDIEHLVRWAYRDELPKAPRETTLLQDVRPAWGSMGRFAELLAVVQEPDIRNAFGMFPDAVSRDPHPDAVAVYEAVEVMATCNVDLSGGLDLLADMGDLGGEAYGILDRGLAKLVTKDDAGRPRLRNPVSQLVIRAAILGAPPVWEAEKPERRLVCEHGKPKWFRRMAVVSDGAFAPASYEIEVDGYNHSRQRPFPGAYQKWELVPDPVPVVVERAEYVLWFSALTVLAEALAEVGLQSHVVLPPARAARPWEGDVPEGRILPSLLTPPPVVREKRKKKSAAA